MQLEQIYEEPWDGQDKRVRISKYFLPLGIFFEKLLSARVISYVVLAQVDIKKSFGYTTT